MAKRPPISTADLKDLVPKLNRLVTSLKPSQRTALARPFTAAAAGSTPPAEIQKFLDSKTRIHPATRSIALGVAAGVEGGGGGVNAGVEGTHGGIMGGVETSGGGVSGGVASSGGGVPGGNPKRKSAKKT